MQIGLLRKKSSSSGWAYLIERKHNSSKRTDNWNNGKERKKLNERPLNVLIS